MGRKIGVYGGSFDPIHLGHMNLAVEIMEARNLDEVWFCPSYINPNKLEGSSASAEHRVNMVKLVIADEPRFCVIENELKRNGPSYTIETLRELLATRSHKEDSDCFFLIIGEDAAKNFYRWHQPEEIIKLAPLLVGQRGPSIDWDKSPGNSLIHQAIKNGITQTRILEISSTEIRQRLSKKLFCGHLLQGKVLDYILSHHLYSINYDKTS